MLDGAEAAAAVELLAGGGIYRYTHTCRAAVLSRGAGVCCGMACGERMADAYIYICMRLRGAAPGPTSEHVRSRVRYKEGVCYLYSSLYGHMSGGMRRVELTDMRHSICARL